MFEKYRVVHFVGIGGIGMSGIAELLFNLGYEVRGSDLKESDTTRRLRSLGIEVYIGHRPEHIGEAHVVVISSAVSMENPEVAAARMRSIPVIPRAEMLAELARLKYGILVAGAHGKTTTTSLVTTVLAQGGFDPTVVIGGKLKATGTNARLGQGAFLVAEADESDGSFLKLSPAIAIVTNIDREHMDFFQTMHSLKEAFLSFINKVPFYGAAIVCIENEHLRELLPSIHRRCITYGFSHEAELRAENIRKKYMSVMFDVVHKDGRIDGLVLPVPGEHNVLNSLAAIGVAMELNMEPEIIREALQCFGGIQRRFELKGEVNGIRVYDDYGHHPVEIQVTLRAAKESIGVAQEGGRVHVLFQPHRYTRTRDLMDEFACSFYDADTVLVLDIYPAGQKPIEGVSAKTLAEKIGLKGHPNSSYMKGKDMAVEYIASHARRGDIVFTIGAGDVWKSGDLILSALRQKNRHVGVSD